jgi:hypothetical protein
MPTTFLLKRFDEFRQAGSEGELVWVTIQEDPDPRDGISERGFTRTTSDGEAMQRQEKKKMGYGIIRMCPVEWYFCYKTRKEKIPKMQPPIGRCPPTISYAISSTIIPTIRGTNEQRTKIQTA